MAIRAAVMSLAVTTLFAAMAWAGGSGFSFSPPAGFVDLKHGAPPPPGAVPIAILAEAKQAQHLAFAAAVDAQGAAIFFADAQPSVGAIDDHAVEEIARDAAASTGFTLLEERLDRIGDVPVARVIGEAGDKATPGQRQRLLVYFVPGRDGMAMLVYSAEPTRFDSLLPAFESSAHATRGAFDLARARTARLVGLSSVAAFLLACAVVAVLVARRPKRR